MSTKIWIVSEYGWEFDDSKYYKPEYYGSTPQLAFTIPELAQKICNEKNVQFVRNNRGFSGYIEPDDVAYNLECEIDFFCEHYGLDPMDLSFKKDINEVSDAEILRIIAEIGISFYEVVSVELLA